MEGLDASERYERQPQSEQSPCLLTIILDTNPAAWALLADLLPLSKAVADILVFINAHLASQFTNKIAVIASHSDKAQFLFPTPTEQIPCTSENGNTRKQDHDTVMADADDDQSSKRRRPNTSTNSNGSLSNAEGNKYRPFRKVEEEMCRNLQTLLASTSPDKVSTHTSTMVAGALTLALSYINRETTAHNEATTGSHPNLSDPSTTHAVTTTAPGDTNSLTNPLQSRILLVTVSPSADLAHQYIPIMNSIFACQRLSIPIDVLQILLPRPSQPATSTTASRPNTTTNNSTVFLQQAADATHGVFIPADLSLSPSPSPSNPNASALLAYLLTALLPPPGTRHHLILPTRVDVDFRAACFCHRDVISTGFVCSICLSIFCAVPEGGECLTCGTALKLGDYGGRPVVVVPRKEKRGGGKKKGPKGGGGVGRRSGMATPVAG